jgi:hypothetical protein
MGGQNLVFLSATQLLVWFLVLPLGFFRCEGATRMPSKKHNAHAKNPKALAFTPHQ